MAAAAASGMMLSAVQDALHRRMQRGIADDQTQVAMMKNKEQAEGDEMRQQTMLERMKAQADGQIAKANLEASWHIPVAEIQAKARGDASENQLAGVQDTNQARLEATGMKTGADAKRQELHDKATRGMQLAMKDKDYDRVTDYARIMAKSREVVGQNGSEKSLDYLIGLSATLDAKQAEKTGGAVDKFKGTNPWTQTSPPIAAETGRLTAEDQAAKEASGVSKQRVVQRIEERANQPRSGGSWKSTTKPAYPPPPPKKKAQYKDGYEIDPE